MRICQTAVVTTYWAVYIHHICMCIFYKCLSCKYCTPCVLENNAHKILSMAHGKCRQEEGVNDFQYREVLQLANVRIITAMCHKCANVEVLSELLCYKDILI